MRDEFFEDESVKSQKDYPFKFDLIKPFLSPFIMSFSKFKKLVDSKARKEKKELQDRMDKLDALHISLSGYLTKAQKKVIDGFRRDLEITTSQMKAVYEEKLKEQEFFTMDREILFLTELAKDAKTYGQEETKDK